MRGHFPLHPSAIAAMVPMERLLAELGFSVNRRRRRAPCVLHGGRNPGAFSWTEDGRWYCFNCGIGGDRIELVKRVKNYEFRDALEFVARLAGVEVSSDRATFSQIEKHRQEQGSLDVATEKLRLLEAHLRQQYRQEIYDLEKIKDMASGILQAKHERAECDRESEWAWSAIELAKNWLPRVAAGYTILSFASAKERATFALQPERAEGIIEETLQRGHVLDDCGRVCEVLQ